MNILKTILLKTLFALHAGIFLFFPGAFFIPSKLWPGRIEFHFYYTLIITASFLLWGSLWTFTKKDKVYMTCILSSLQQRIKGYKLMDERNYKYSFVEELSQKIGIKCPAKNVAKLSILLLMISTLFYLLKLKGIVLY